MLHLYYQSLSYNSQKVRLYLSEFNIPWKGTELNLLKQEQLAASYLAINPAGLVPALQDNGKTIVNSTDIMQHLKDNYTNPELHCNNISDEIYTFSKQDEGMHDPYIRTLSFSQLWMKKKKSPKEIDRILTIAKTHPTKARGEFLCKAVLQQFTEEEIQIAKDRVHERLSYIETLLENNSLDFIFGHKYSMADAIVTAFITRLKRLQFANQLKDYPSLLSYYEIMQKRPNFLTSDIS